MSTFAKLVRPADPKPATSKSPTRRPRGSTLAQKQPPAEVLLNTLEETIADHAETTVGEAVRRASSGSLEIGAAGTPTEREADRIADELVGDLHGRPTERASHLSEGHIQRRASDPSPVATPVRREELAGGGSPLPEDLHASLRSRLGYDFSQVRVHADQRAASLASRVGAEAFTWKHHIVFSRDSFHPDTPAGLHLLGHELIHTAQQGAAPRTNAAAVPVSTAPADRLQGRLLTQDERKNDSRKRKQAKRHTGIVRLWLDQLPTKELLEPGPLRTRWAEMALELEKASEPGFTLTPHEKWQIQNILPESGQPSPHAAMKPSPAQAEAPQQQPAQAEVAAPEVEVVPEHTTEQMTQAKALREDLASISQVSNDGDERLVRPPHWMSWANRPSTILRRGSSTSKSTTESSSPTSTRRKTSMPSHCSSTT
jgi:hypothetical protein